MRKVLLPAACLGVLLGVPAATPAVAFGCGWAAVECYDKVRLPDVYAVQTRPVVLSPAWREVVPTPPVVRTYAVPVEVRPGRWRTHVYPPVYGMKMQRVLVAPPGRTYEEIPAVTRRVSKTVVVSPGGFRWQHRRGLFGHERLCKVRVAPVTRTVVREVVVSPARRIAHVRRPIYREVLRPVLIRPATAERVYEPPVHAVLNRPVVVRPAGVQIYDHPPVVGVAEERVLVHEGGYAWRPSRRLFGRW